MPSHLNELQRTVKKLSVSRSAQMKEGKLLHGQCNYINSPDSLYMPAFIMHMSFSCAIGEQVK